MRYEIREMRGEDHAEAVTLWTESEGVVLREADSRQNIESFLTRNPGLSFVAVEGDRLVGVALCGHDGRRGYIHHVAVTSDRRRQGIGQALVERSLVGLAAAGIAKCHLFVLSGNAMGQKFWEQSGWSRRDDIIVMSRNLSDSENP